MDFQFYPTPLALAEKLWSLFKNFHYSDARVLEPSAGEGHLMPPKQSDPRDRYNRRQIDWDACEINAEKHSLLREKGAKVVGVDFLDFRGGEVYSHIAMNPPFAQGCQHLLHAWDILFDGEIACILNAETIRNPFSKERQYLANLIERHGSVEYATAAFCGEGVERETTVEIALCYLRKQADSSALLGDVVGKLAKEERKIDEGMNFDHGNQIMLPKGFVEDMVARFNLAVESTKEKAQAVAKASYYTSLVGMTLEGRNARDSDTGRKLQDFDKTPGVLKQCFAADYAELKNAAWASILRSSEVMSKLSSNAQKRMEKEFENIKCLEFTAINIYGFLLGVAQAATEIQTEMVCDVFDAISRYHEDNTVYYMGWKSNTKHRTVGMRLKSTRFVLPGFQVSSSRYGLMYDQQQKLADFDKVFSMLDGKAQPANGLAHLFDGTPGAMDALREGKRLDTDYFQIRHYPLRGTIHFFPKSKELMDRLNRVVGNHRKWLPPDLDQTSADFKRQYNEAEKFDKEIRETFRQECVRHSCDYYHLTREGEDGDYSRERMLNAMDKVLDSHGIHPFESISHDGQEQLLLLAA
jgi:hypothetical protein